jgi:hypothetical protein
MGQGTDPSFAPPPPMNQSLPTDTTTKYQRDTDAPPPPVQTMQRNGFDQ